ncbi:GatB/YqeY domain-containing protein [Cereibacter sphaeroides]|uniref:GatB/YqeY domain-containing protein n=1 Tax=Cereibacter sphaeroides TaxID=1063 RepID=UPI001F46C26B|nr:GatB/YqeY domain-containing protein [Cereibacter sphaeroides]MCE6959598.1 GatB/YqeY domain-containing protein [Cereibacter sphaeroides]MCE6974542.1 GatB/YqeY domain-containing protein [Cereibacter sphaeroides]
MSLLSRIQADALAARKARAPVAGVLVTLIGEVNKETKLFNPARDLTDDEVLGLVRKFLKNIDQTLQILNDAGGTASDAIAKARTEKAALEVYMPRQMSAEELAAFARGKLAGGANLGAIMAALKAEHAGLYDGKLASEVVRGVIAGA